MVDFAGFLMPLQYEKQSIIESHLHTRTACSIFDVSHMLQTKIFGKDRMEFVESLTVADVKEMKANHSCLSLFTNSKGGIEDDVIITQTSEEYIFLVTNAGCISKDKKLMEKMQTEMKSRGKDVHLEYLEEDHSLLAVQGPRAERVLQPFIPYDLKQQTFMTSRSANLMGVSGCRVTRCGYTGEDGFEISVGNTHVHQVIERLLESREGEKQVFLAGLGARDTLRLEAGLCLYGNDITEKTTPVEAALLWTIGKNRRKHSDFPGAEIILEQIEKKAKTKRVGLMASEPGPAARHDSPVISPESKEVVGRVTSGGRSPSLNKNICMAYVPLSQSKVGTQLLCDVRGKQILHEVTKMPFLPTNYYTLWAFPLYYFSSLMAHFIV